MSRKRLKPEQIITELREAEVLLSKGLKVGAESMLVERKVLVERWRQEYNRFCPHSSQGYRLPAQEALDPPPMAQAV